MMIEIHRFKLENIFDPLSQGHRVTGSAGQQTLNVLYIVFSGRRFCCSASFDNTSRLRAVEV